MDKGTTERLYGNYRALVVDNKDKQKFGRILVWIPDLMEGISQDQGLWARPANNPVGGRNRPANYPVTTRRGGSGDNFNFDDPPIPEAPENWWAGSCFIPPKGSWTWVFFETGNINRPYYFGALDIENTRVLAENQTGENYEDKWTIFKSHKGRTIVISDDPDDERTEMTGKKHKLPEEEYGQRYGPSGDPFSVFKIKDNMNTILIDEREYFEKILIKTRKGDYINLNIEDQKLEIYTKDEIHIKTDSKFFLTAKDDINILSDEGDINITTELGNINILAEAEKINIEAELDDINIKAGQDTRVESDKKVSITAGQDGHFSAGYNLHHKAGLNLNQDAGGILNDQNGAARSGDAAGAADPADPAEPVGVRTS